MMMSYLAMGFFGAASASLSKPPLLLEARPLKQEFVRGEPIFLLLFVTNESNAESRVPGGAVQGRWEHRRPDGSWDGCRRESWETQVPSEISIAIHDNLRPGESRNLALVSPICVETKGQNVYEVRLVGSSSCCRTSAPVTIKLVPGTSADARARSAPRDWGDFPDSILAGYDYLSWLNLDHMYEDPIIALEASEYRSLRADELDPSIERMKVFLKNFPLFPFAQTVRLRLATELAITGRMGEAQAQLREITGTPQEPRVRQDAQRLESALLARSARKDGGSTSKRDQ